MRVLRLASGLACVVLLAIASGTTHAADAPIPPRSGDLAHYDYPYPVQTYDFTSQRDKLKMAYMDVQPLTANGKVAVLLHGKNFCSAYWKPTIQHLTRAGYRVIAPDQIGFCKSSKPQDYQYSLGQLAANTHALLESLHIDRITLIGHSMGGMLAIRYALMYPESLNKLVLVDPIGLEDWMEKGVPYQTVDQWYAHTLKTDFASIKAYQMKNYFGGQWNDHFAEEARLQAGMYKGPDKAKVAWAAARTYDMIMTQPVVHELGDIRVPTTLIIGQADRTAVGKNFAPPALRAKLGNYPVLGAEAAAAIPDAQLIRLPGLGHLPQMQDPGAFYPAFDQALGIHGDTPPASSSTSAAPAAPASAPAPSSTSSRPTLQTIMEHNATDRGIQQFGTPAQAGSTGLPAPPASSGAGG